MPGWILCMVVVFALTSSGMVVAEKNAEPVLLLGVLSDGRLSNDLSAHLTTVLSRSERLSNLEGLRQSERQCREYKCLAELAETRRAAFVMSIDIKRRDSPLHGEILSGQLYDHRKHGGEPDTLPCDEAELTVCVEELAARMLARHRNPPRLTKWISPEDPLSELRKYETRRRPLPAWRSAVAAGLVPIALISLTGAIVLSIYHHSPTDGVCDDAPDWGAQIFKHNTKCAWDNITLLSTGYAVAAASTIGIGMTLGLR